MLWFQTRPLWAGAVVALALLLPSRANAAPTCSITSPASPTAISGTAGDTGGIQKVLITFGRLQFDSGNYYYWNGSEWSTSGSFITATLGTPSNGNVAWSWPTSVATPVLDLSPCRYVIRATAYNNANQTTQATAIYAAGTDTTGPTVAFTDNVDPNIPVTSLTFPAGSATDPSGVQRSQYLLWRNGPAGNEYWNGTAWSATALPPFAALTAAAPFDQQRSVVTFNSPLLSTTQLPTGINLPPGRYSWRLDFWDNSQNGSTLSRVVLITPQDTTNPTVSISTPSTTEN